MSLERMKELSKNRYDLDKLPKEIELKTIAYEFKPDKQGRECLFVRFETRENETLTQKYTPMHFDYLVEAFDALGITGGFIEISEKWVLFKQFKFRIGNPRLLPNKVLSE